MKKTIVIISLILGILFPMQAQDYLYKKNSDPEKISFDKLYVTELSEKYYLTDNPEIESDVIAGEYKASGVSGFHGSVEEWTLTITRDDSEVNKIWIHPVLNPFSGLSAEDVAPVYAYYDDVAGTINLPLGQTLYGGPGQSYNILLCSYDMNNGEVHYGDAVGSFTTTESTVEIVWSDMLCAYQDGFYQALHSMNFIRVAPADAVGGNVTPLTEIDSISKVAPVLRLLSYEKNEYSPSIDLYFNYNLLSPYIYTSLYSNKKFTTQGWFNETISYKAYDSDNNIVKEDYIDIYGIDNYNNNNRVNLMLQGFQWEEGADAAYYILDGFLPCDTAFKVAFTISPDALVWAGDSTIAYEGLESYIDAQGNRHGIVIDYYNERPRLLSASPLNCDPENLRRAYLQFSESVISLYMHVANITYSVYRKSENTNKYDIVQTGSDFYLYLNETQGEITLPDDVRLYNGDIIAISYDNWGVCDIEYCSVTPSSMQSGVDADGNPYGLWWMINETDTPYYTASNAESLKHSNKGKQVTVTFNENIVRTDDMPAVTFEVYDSFDNNVCYAQGTASAMASGKNLVVTLPDDFEFKAETLSVVLLSFAEGAVEDMYGNKMAAVTNGFDESGLPKALWWSYNPTAVFFQEGNYNFKVAFTEQGEQYEGDLSVEFALQSDSYDLTQLFGQNAPAQTGIEWSVNGLLSSMYNGVTDKAFPAISFKYEYQGNNIEDVFMIDPTTGSTCIGTIDVMGDGTQSNVYIGYVDEQSGNLQLYWYFTLADENQNPNAPVEDLMGWFVGGGAPRILVYGDFGQGEGYYTLMMFDNIYLMRDGSLDAANVTVFDKPVKVELAGNPISFSGVKTNFNR